MECSTNYNLTIVQDYVKNPPLKWRACRVLEHCREPIAHTELKRGGCSREGSRSLKEHRDLPIKFNDLRKQLNKRVMSKDVLIILGYLNNNGKIIYGHGGVQWIYTSPQHIKQMLGGGLEV